MYMPRVPMTKKSIRVNTSIFGKVSPRTYIVAVADRNPVQTTDILSLKFVVSKQNVAKLKRHISHNGKIVFNT